MKSNLPNFSRKPTLWSLSGSGSGPCSLKSAQAAFFAPAPFSGFVIACPADMITSTSDALERNAVARLEDLAMLARHARRTPCIARRHCGRFSSTESPWSKYIPIGISLASAGRAPMWSPWKCVVSEVVDFLEPGLLRRGENALRVAIVGRAVRGVHQQRLAARSDDQRGRAALRIDPVNFKILGGAEHHAEGKQGKKK